MHKFFCAICVPSADENHVTRPSFFPKEADFNRAPSIDFGLQYGKRNHSTDERAPNIPLQIEA